MSNTITGPPRPVMGEDARTRYTAALSVRAGRQHGPLRVATVGEAKAAAALAHRYGWTVAPDVDAADALAVALPAGTLGGAADTAVRTALRRGLPILIQIGGDLAAFPDCWAVGVPGGYRLRAPAEPGPATTATLAYLGITAASKRAAGSGHGESPKAAPDTSSPPVVVSTAEQHAEQALRTARREVTPAAIAKLPAPHTPRRLREAVRVAATGAGWDDPDPGPGRRRRTRGRQGSAAGPPGSGSCRRGRDRRPGRRRRRGGRRAHRRGHGHRTDVDRTPLHPGVAAQRIPRNHPQAHTSGVAHEQRRPPLPTPRTATRVEACSARPHRLPVTLAPASRW